MHRLGEPIWPAVKPMILRYVIPTWCVMALTGIVIQNWSGWVFAAASIVIAVLSLAAYR